MARDTPQTGRYEFPLQMKWKLILQLTILPIKGGDWKKIFSELFQEKGPRKPASSNRKQLIDKCRTFQYLILWVSSEDGFLHVRHDLHEKSNCPHWPANVVSSTDLEFIQLYYIFSPAGFLSFTKFFLLYLKQKNFFPGMNHKYPLKRFSLFSQNVTKFLF